MLHRMHGKELDNPAELLLSGSIHGHGTIFEHICARPRLRNSSAVLSVAKLLYFDDTTEMPKRGATVGDASIQRFGSVLRNLPAEYDLEMISPHTIQALLPSDFDVWLSDDKSLSDLRDTRQLLDMRTDIDAMSDPTKIAEILQEVASRKLSKSQRLVRSDKFRVGVLSAYDTTCAISGVGLTHKMRNGETRYEVHAAHIIPVASGGADIVQNGLALSRTIHWAFDEGMLWIDPDLRVNASEESLSDQRNEFLRRFDGRRLNLPHQRSLAPHGDALRWHAQNVAEAGSY